MGSIKWGLVAAFGLLVACSGSTSGDGSGAGGDGTGNDPNGNGGNGNDGGIKGDFCEQLDVGAQRGIPNVLIVLDRSGSMDQPASGNQAQTKWRLAKPAVQNVTGNLESSVAFGLMLYNTDNDCGAGQVFVDPATDSASDIRRELGTGPGGGTPTAASLIEAGQALKDVSGGKYVLLVTDGAPNCNLDLDNTSCTCTCHNSQCDCDDDSQNCLDDVRTIKAVADLAADGIKTYVIGFDTTEWEDVLNGMAAAGGTGMNTYIPVDDGPSLENTLSMLASNVVACSYELDTAPADYRYVRVQLDGNDLEHVSQTDGKSGWELAGKTINLVGSTCEAVQNADDPKLSISVECEQQLL